MPLDETAKQRAMEWITSNVPSQLCPCCGHLGPYALSDCIAPPVLDVLTNEINVQKSVPMIGVMCNNCGNVRLFSTVMMGITPGAKPDTR